MKTFNALIRFQLILLIVIFGHLSGIAQYSPSIDTELLASGFVKPVDIISTGNDDRLFIVEQDGRVRIVDTAGTVFATPFMDIDPLVRSTENERGLLGMTFHPDYASNGYFYVNYTDNSGTTIISRWSVDASDPNQYDPSSEEIIISISQPFWNHNAGDLEFGPDGYLYIPLGDGGSAGDPGNRSQNPLTLLGKTLRLDVDGGTPYAIPADNPFVSTTDTLDEIWSLGWRNPWRFSFDSTGNMWVADVGQDFWEEIHVEPAGHTGGGNYGWRCYEGDAPFNLTGCAAVSEYIPSTFVYSHSVGQSVTGGFVYEGNGYPGLKGFYIFCDFLTGQYWATGQNMCDDSFETSAIGVHNDGVSTFGEDSYGELYLASLFTGSIYRVIDSCSQYEIPTLMADTSSFYVNGAAGASVQWFEDCMLVSGATDTAFTSPLLDTYYYAVITYPDGCQRQTTADMLVQPAGLNSLDALGEVSVYPNPADDFVTLDYAFQTSLTNPVMELHNSLGQVVAPLVQLDPISGRAQVATQDLPSGLYLMVVKSNEGTTTRSLIIR